ncbi:hypothetical protein DOY81_001373 [Sarcophaga bullata]|nr:hypothetical protein DOY81_001373 [Sarcophaga bullata]
MQSKMSNDSSEQFRLNLADDMDYIGFKDRRALRLIYMDLGL